MRRFRDWSLRTKLTLIILVSAGVAVGLVTAASVAYEIVLVRQTLSYNLATLADVIGGSSTAALTFRDPEAAAESLQALTAYPPVIAAALYSSEGKVFASYARDPHTGWVPPSALSDQAPRFEGGHLTIMRPVMLGRDRVGAIYMRSDLRGASERIQRYILVALFAAVGASIAAFGVASRLQRVVSVPIADLAHTVQRVGAENNYSLRVAPHGRDELGALIDGFNDMMTQIHVRDEALREARADLERRVDERTQELRLEIAERQRAQSALTGYAAQLEAANKELEAFSYSVSHDLRAPLRSINSFSQALLDEYDDRLDEQGREYLRRARAASERMAALIDDMLELSRVTRSEMRREPVDLTALASAVAGDLHKTAPERSVDWVIAPGLTAVGDARLLRVVLENLFANAWKFTRRQARPRIELGLGESRELSAFFVRDNGAGFDMSYANKLFGAFQRLHSEREFEGTGIGLATVQRIVHRHGGQIWAEGAVDQGAVFWWTLP